MLDIFRVEKPVIGMVHLKPLPGSPNSLPFSEVLEHALEDAEALVTNEIDGLIVENFMDSPFYPKEFHLILFHL